jgi:mercuric ion transport protein
MATTSVRRSSPPYPFVVAQKAELFADWTGPIGSVFAALCCLGVSWLVAAISAVGLSFLRADAILWPLMIASIVVAVWGMWAGHRTHRSFLPLLLGVLSGVALIAGVIFVHGFPARELIYAGSAGLTAASLWNAAARRSCERMGAGHA